MKQEVLHKMYFLSIQESFFFLNFAELLHLLIYQITLESQKLYHLFIVRKQSNELKTLSFVEAELNFKFEKTRKL